MIPIQFSSIRYDSIVVTHLPCVPVITCLATFTLNTDTHTHTCKSVCVCVCVPADTCLAGLLPVAPPCLKCVRTDSLTPTRPPPATAECLRYVPVCCSKGSHPDDGWVPPQEPLSVVALSSLTCASAVSLASHCQ